MGGGGDSEEGSTENTIHYAEFWESALSDYLNHSGADRISKSVFGAINDALGQSPYTEGEWLSPANGYLGSSYTLGDFPSLFDMYGKFMAGLDVHVLWEQTYAGLRASPAVSDSIEAEGQRLSDDLEQVQLPRFHAGMRDIGAVNSTAFALGRALLEDSRTKALEDYSAKLQVGLLSESTRMWTAHLEWNKSVILAYHDLHQGFQSQQREANAQNLEFLAKDRLWDLSLYETGRAVLGTVSGAAGTTPNSVSEPSQTQKALSGALSGASFGTAIGGPVGGLVGGALGGIAGFFS